MYTVKDITNMSIPNYELSKTDEIIFNSVGLMIHQIDKNSVIYKEHSGSLLGQNLLCISRSGHIIGERWYLDEYENREFEEVEWPENVTALAQRKHDEMIETYWA